MLSVRNLSLSYGSFRALESVEIQADLGELVVLLGANGAGKTSVFRAISGLHPASGRVTFGNADLLGLKPSQVVREGVVQCPEGRKLFPLMSVRKNLMLGAFVHASDKAGNEQRVEQILQMFPILAQKFHEPVGSLSGGQQQMVAIGRALMGRPKVLLLDEPSLGLAPLVVKQMFEIIQEINRTGTTILLAEQNAYAALRVCTRAYVLERGRIVMQGSSKQLLGDEKVRQAYIGA